MILAQLADNFNMKKFILLQCFVFFSFFPLSSQKSQSQNFVEILEKSQNYENQKYKSSITEIPVGNNSLFVRVYYFNSQKEGSEIADEIYGFKKIPPLEEIEFTKLKMISPGDKFSAFSYGMFRNNNEFWILHNEGDGWVWGKGFNVN